MLKRYRVALIATGVILVLLFWALLTHPNFPSTQIGDPPKAPNTEYTYEGSYKSGTGFSFVSSSKSESGNAPAKSTENAEKSNQRPLSVTEADLLAQERVAHWTLWIATFTAAGLVALIFAFDETRQMTTATREIGENQTKAYVNFIGAKIVKARNGAGEIYTRAVIDVRNVGQSPATKIRIVGIVEILSCPASSQGREEEKVTHSDSFWQENLTVLASSDKPTPVPVAFSAGTDESLRRAGRDPMTRNTVRVSGEIIYRDVFRHWYITEFQFQSDVRDGLPLQETKPGPDQPECYKKVSPYMG